MSRVFVARDARLDRRIVVKVLSPDLARAVSVERVEREILVAARLQDPRIVPLLSTGNAGGLPYLPGSGSQVSQPRIHPIRFPT
jgi:serine/threonine-protein kinase